MATLTRPKSGTTQQPESTDSTGVDLSSTVPTPFPQLRRIRANSSESQRRQSTSNDIIRNQTHTEFQESNEQISSIVQSEDSQESHTEQVSFVSRTMS